MKVVYPICCGVDVHKTFLVGTIISTTDGVQALQSILGHTDIKTTMNVYGDVFDKYQFDSVSRANDYMRDMGVSLMA